MTIYYPPGTGGGLLATGVPGGSLWYRGHAEVGDRLHFWADAAVASGFVQFVYFTAPASNTITKLGVSTGSTTSASISLARIGLFTTDSVDSLTLVARTAGQTQATFGNNANRDYSFALDTTGGFPSSYTFHEGQRYALGLVQVGVTPASLKMANFSNGGSPPALVRFITGQTDLATSYTNSGGELNGDFQIPYLFGLAA